MTVQDDGLQFTISQSIVIRKARQDDIRKLEWHGQFIHFRKLFQRSFREQQQGNRLLLVATSNDYPIARLFVQFKSQSTIVADGKTRGYLYSFHVMEPFQRRGIGSRLVNVAERILLRRQFQTVTIAVAKDNSGALALYKRLGYEIFTENEGHWSYYDHHGKRQEVYEPCWVLEKTLASN